MKTLFRYFLHSPKTLSLCLLTLAALIFNLWASQILTASYTESRFPVPYYLAQLSFNPTQLKAWYATLIEQNTLQTYLLTQHIDSLFILSTLLLHGFALILISRLFALKSKGRSILVVCAFISAIAPISDQLENLVSYIMLMNPTDFSNWLAYVYSSFAAIKFAFFVFAYAAAPLGLISGIATKLLTQFTSAKPTAQLTN